MFLLNIDAVLARHSTAAQGPTALYSRDLVTAALRSLVKVLEAIRQQAFFPDKSRSGMITPVPAPRAPGPMMPMPSTPMPSMQTENQEVAMVEEQQDVASVAPSPESPLPETPKSWQKIDWPTDEVVDVESQAPDPPDLLKDWDSDSSNSCSDSDSDSDVEVSLEQAGEPDKASQAAVPSTLKWYINGGTLVIHERRNEKLFKCGRVIGPPYFPVHQLTGLRCGQCFANTL